MINAVDLITDEGRMALPGAIRRVLAGSVLEYAEALDWPLLVLVETTRAYDKHTWKQFANMAHVGLLEMALRQLRRAYAEREVA